MALTLTPRTLIVASAYPDPPFDVLEEGSPSGFDIELMRAISSQLGLALRPVRYSGDDFNGIFDGRRIQVKWNQCARRTRSAPSPLVGEGWGGGWCSEISVVPPAQNRTTPTPNPSPAEVGFTRLRPSKMPNSGKPEFGWGGEHTEIVARSSTLIVKLLANGSYDAVVSGTTITPERATVALFSEPYLQFNQGVLSVRSSPRKRGPRGARP